MFKITLEILKALTIADTKAQKVHGVLNVVFKYMAPTPTACIQRLEFISRSLRKFNAPTELTELVYSGGCTLRGLIEDGSITDEDWQRYYPLVGSFFSATIAGGDELSPIDRAMSFFSRTEL